MRLIRSVGRAAGSVVILAVVKPAVWWSRRRIRRAGADFRRAEFYATRGLRTMMALGRIPLVFTASGVPAVSQSPPDAR